MINRIVFIAVLILTFQFVYAQKKTLIKQIDVELDKAMIITLIELFEDETYIAK